MTFNKKEYWKNRKDGKRGQGEEPEPVVIPNTDSEATVGFDNSGNMVIKNRAYRRQRVRLPGNDEGKIPPRKMAEHRKKQRYEKRKEQRIKNSEKDYK